MVPFHHPSAKHTTSRFPRASSDNVLRGPGVIQGPYSSRSHRWMSWLFDAVLWIAGSIMFFGLILFPYEVASFVLRVQEVLYK